MKNILTAFAILLLLLLSACAQKKIDASQGQPNAELRLSISEGLSPDTKYRLYVNNEEVGITLEPAKQFIVYIPAGETRIAVTKNRQSAELLLKVKKNERYALHLQNDEREHIELIQIRVSSE